MAVGKSRAGTWVGVPRKVLKNYSSKKLSQVMVEARLYDLASCLDDYKNSTL